MARRGSEQVEQRDRPRLRTTVGELLAAAFDAAGGTSDAAARLLERGPLAERGVRARLRFV